VVRPYSYLLYRIYFFYVDRMREEQVPLVYVTAISTVLIFVNVFTLLGLADHYGIFSLSMNKYSAAATIAIMGTMNYFFFIRGERFLDYDFKKDLKGGMLIVLYFVMTLLLFILVANQHREKILNAAMIN
jgi:hypothetical protein